MQVYFLFLYFVGMVYNITMIEQQPNQSSQSSQPVKKIEDIAPARLEKEIRELREKVNEEIGNFVVTLDPNLSIKTTTSLFETKLIDQESQIRVELFRNGEPANFSSRFMEPLSDGADALIKSTKEAITKWYREQATRKGDIQQEKLAA